MMAFCILCHIQLTYISIEIFSALDFLRKLLSHLNEGARVSCLSGEIRIFSHELINLKRPQLILVSTTTTGGWVLQTNVPSSIENAKYWPVLAHFGTNSRIFGNTCYRPKYCGSVPKMTTFWNVSFLYGHCPKGGGGVKEHFFPLFARGCKI